MLEKFVGNSLETIDNDAFKYSSFLKEINLKNVKAIGFAAFSCTSLKLINNNFIKALGKSQFYGLNDDVKKVKMKSLTSIGTSTFVGCTINEFDAPNLNSITVDTENYSGENLTFTVGKKNFKDSPGILKK